MGAPSTQLQSGAPADLEGARPLSRRLRRPRLSRLQTLGVFFGMLGVVLVVRVAGALDPEPQTVAFGVGELAPTLAFNPATVVLGIGVLLVIAAGIALADRWTGRWAGIALVGATVLIVPLLLVLSLALSGPASTNVLTLLTESLRLGTPIALGSLAGLWCERSGVINIGIEGMMLSGAGIGFVAYTIVFGGAGGLGLAAAIGVAAVVGGLMAGLHALLCVTFRTDQIVSGVAINLLAIGLTSFLRREVLLPAEVGSAPTTPMIDLPFLSELPVIGPPLFTGKPIFFSMFLIFVLTQVVLFRTTWGLRVRSVGENPHAAETQGLKVMRTRFQAIILGGVIAGLAGAWYSLETVGGFDDVMTGGTGFIALAAMIFGKWRPWGAFGGAMLFGLSAALGTRVQLLQVEVAGFPVPSQFAQVLPYVVTIIVLAGAIGRAVPPASIGVPYERSR